MTDQEILFQYRKVKSIRKTAAIANISSKTVQSILSSFGDTSWMTIDVSDELINFIVNSYNEGKSIKKICSNISLSQHYVGCIIKARSEIRKRTQKKEPPNKNFFETIDSEEKAYWLGLLYADGYVDTKKRCLELTLKDKEHVEKFAKLIICENNVKEKYSKINNKEYINYRTIIFSNKVVSDLISQGCYSNKSLTLMFPNINQVPDNLLNHFIRGYYDGDGVCRNNGENKGFLGTKMFLEVLKSILIRNILPNGKLNILAQKSIYEIRLGKQDTIKLDNYMYKNATIFLSRKK